jgi:thioredoxin reductase/NAD-dependent dihydropyrimidine dehydrogenase PreA subunit
VTRARPRAHARGDAQRSQGLLVGVGLGVAVLVAGALSLEGPGAFASPGPVALPHRELGCADCHQGASASSACASCHGAHDSRRAAHRELASAGELRCGDCHAVHRAEHGVRFEPSGNAVLFGTGYETAIPSPLAGAPAVTVPLVEARACARCHDLASASDPVAPCVAASRSGFATCFDEHRAPAGATREARPERDGAVEAARAVALSAPSRPWTAGFAAQALLLGGAVGLGLAGSYGRRRMLLGRARLGTTSARPSGSRRLPVIDTTRCLGCHACVDACPYDVLEVRRYVAVVARPDACCGAGPCETRCPNGSLTLAAAGPSAELPLDAGLEVRGNPGVFLAGDVAGGSLIRNALRQGVLVARAVAARRNGRRSAPDVADLVVIGAGPAGLSAALTARSLGLRAVVLEQASLAESIRRFSRQKLVLDTGDDPDEPLPLFIADAYKEELVERWSYDVRRARVELREGLRAVGLEPRGDDGVHRVLVEDARGVRSEVSGHAVLVAIGRRGTPRTLDVPIEPAMLPRVHYELSDARAFAGKRAVVVGLGDVAMETALALAAQPGTRITVVHRGEGFRRGRKRNIEALSSLVARGRVELLSSAHPTAVSSEGVAVKTASGCRTLACDALFVAIGSLPSRDLLAAAGVCVRS